MPRAGRHRGDAPDARRAHARGLGTHVVLRRPRILGALEAGAVGYLLKDAASDEVAEGVRAAAAASRRWTRAPRARSYRPAGPDPLGGCRREREVLALLVEGLPNKLIARRLGHQREDGQDAPDGNLPGARGDRPHAGRALGAAQRLHRAPRPMTATEVPLRDRRWTASLVSVRPTLLVLSLLVALALPTGASARHGNDDEVRAAGTCGGGARSELKLKARDGGIEAEFEVDHRGAGRCGG